MLGNNSETISNDMDISCSSIDEVKNIRGILSLKLLTTLDPFIETIIHQTPFVTGYRMTFDDKWSRMGIEGFLYVVNRTKKPIHSFILINKKSEDHLIEYITPEFQMNRNGNYIFYRSKDINNNTLNSLQGLWFFDENECKTTYEKLCDITNNKSPLQYNISSINSLYNNLNEVPVETPTIKKQETISQDGSSMLKDESTKQVKSIGSFLLDTITFKSAKLKQEKKEETEPSNLLKTLFKKTDEPKTNLEGKHLMTLLKSSVKTEENKANETEESSKLLTKFDLEEKLLSSITQNKENEPKVTVNYQTLKEVMLEVAQSDEFVSLVWEKLKNRTS